jgi:hypothetical protein
MPGGEIICLLAIGMLIKYNKATWHAARYPSAFYVFVRLKQLQVEISSRYHLTILIPLQYANT